MENSSTEHDVDMSDIAEQANSAAGADSSIQDLNETGLSMVDAHSIASRSDLDVSGGLTALTSPPKGYKEYRSSPTDRPAENNDPIPKVPTGNKSKSFTPYESLVGNSGIATSESSSTNNESIVAIDPNISGNGSTQRSEPEKTSKLIKTGAKRKYPFTSAEPSPSVEKRTYPFRHPRRPKSPKRLKKTRSLYFVSTERLTENEIRRATFDRKASYCSASTAQSESSKFDARTVDDELVLASAAKPIDDEEDFILLPDWVDEEPAEREPEISWNEEMDCFYNKSWGGEDFSVSRVRAGMSSEQMKSASLYGLKLTRCLRFLLYQIKSMATIGAQTQNTPSRT